LNDPNEWTIIFTMHRITIFHYHLQTGGIAQVISDSVRAILQQAPDAFEIEIVSGREEGTGEFISQLREKCALPPDSPQSGTLASGRLSGGVCELIDYTDMMEKPPAPDRIEEELLRRYGGTIWWIHNYHLGKNPQFTRAVIDSALHHPEQQIVLHIHDFPESGRFYNFKRIHDQIEGQLYPVAPNVRYVVINKRDRDILVNAGIPEDHVFLLNNPIDTDNAKPVDIWHVSEKINTWAGTALPFWEPDGKLLLYPVRAIRRKNVLEAALLTRMIDTPANLLVTLPGRSSQEKQYSDLVARVFEEKLVPGAWAVGTRLDEFGTSFHELTRSADMVLSSSIQEGFGFLFINSLLWSVPLVARELDILDGIKSFFSPERSCFYERISVPLKDPDRRNMKTSFSLALESLDGLLPGDLLAGLATEIDDILKEDTIDYSFLTAGIQYDHLREAAGPSSYREELREINAEVVAVTENLLRGAKPVSNTQVKSAFGPAAHTARVLEVLNSFSSSGGRKDKQPANTPSEPIDEIEEKVLRAFCHADYLRPLFLFH